MSGLARRAVLAALAMGGAARAVPAQAQAASYFPNRPIRLIVPYAPGGTSDILARLIAGPMQATLGQSVIVENRPGAGSLLGTETVVRAPADGYRCRSSSRWRARGPIRCPSHRRASAPPPI
jgi:tripartite-type tricarboxylate transporter receptor subunit TctC